MKEKCKGDFIYQGNGDGRPLTALQLDLYCNLISLRPRCCLDLEVEGKDLACGGMSQGKLFVSNLACQFRRLTTHV